jgi:hypothetical protein
LNFAKQTAFVRDPAPLKAAWCTRRAAKSYSGGLGLYEAMLDTPGCSTLYLALTKASARGIMWKDILKSINAKHNLGAIFNESNLTMVLPNESIAYLTGVDAAEDEMDKLLGKKYRRIIIDEASVYHIDLRRLIYGILKPAIADYRGDIWLIGTASNITQGLFFDVTQGNEPGWSLHTWGALDNPYVAKQWQGELDEIDRLRPLFKQTTLFQQWYLNQWVIDTNKLVYWYNEGRNDYQGLPHFHRGEWQYILGVDLGYRPDPSAFALVAFHEHDRTLYCLESDQKLEMDITDVADRIKWYESRYPIFKVIIDGSNKQAVEEMNRRHNVTVTAADKREKADFIELLNADFVQGLIRVDPKKNAGLIDDWKRLVWQTEGDKIVFPRKEHPGLSNHRTDGFLYAWRFAYNYMSARPKEPVKLKGKEEWMRHTEKLMEEALERQIKHQAAEESETAFWDIQNLSPDEDPLQYYVNKKRGR